MEDLDDLDDNEIDLEGNILCIIFVIAVLCLFKHNYNLELLFSKCNLQLSNSKFELKIIKV